MKVFEPLRLAMMRWYSPEASHFFRRSGSRTTRSAFMGKSVFGSRTVSL